MPRRISLKPHLTDNELHDRYRRAADPVKRSHWHFLWLLAGGMTATTVAAVTGYWGIRAIGSARLPSVTTLTAQTACRPAPCTACSAACPAGLTFRDVSRLLTNTPLLPHTTSNVVIRFAMQ